LTRPLTKPLHGARASPIDVKGFDGISMVKMPIFSHSENTGDSGLISPCVRRVRCAVSLPKRTAHRTQHVCVVGVQFLSCWHCDEHGRGWGVEGIPSVPPTFVTSSGCADPWRRRQVVRRYGAAAKPSGARLLVMSWMAGCSHTALAAQIPQPSQLLVIRDEDEGPGLRVLRDAKIINHPGMLVAECR